MTLEEKAIEFIRETKCKPKDRPDKQIKLFYEEELKLLIGFATEVAKELEQTNNKLLDVINNQDVKIADLEKMLSEQYPDLKQSLDWANKRENENVERLKQAKEIIRTFLNMPMPNNEEVFADVGMFLTKAEQFLKEIEK